MIQVEALSKDYKSVRVLQGINWAIEDGAFVIVTGRSGGGKTTLLSIVGGLTRPDAGRVLIDDTDIWQLSEPDLAALRNEKLGFVFQFPSLIPTLSVLDNVLLPIAFGDKSPNLEDLKFATSLLEMVGISGKDGQYPAQLSGGQQRRAAIARAMIKRPAIILADEPTGDLDEKTEAEIMDLFQSINGQGTTIVMVTHALDYAKIGKTYTLKDSHLFPYEDSEASPRDLTRRGELRHDA